MKRSPVLGVMILAALAGRMFAAPETPAVLLVWTGYQESAFPFIPVGGWNILGSTSVAAAGMGETLFGPNGPAAGFLNPAFLVTIGQPALSLSGRYSRTSYDSSSPGFYGGGRGGVFARGTGYFDQAGLSLPFGRWVVAANYELFQEYNIPGIDSGTGVIAPFSKIDQSGSLRGVSVALARRLGRSFAAGVSFSYLFGSVSRREVNSPIYILANILDAVLPGVLDPWLGLLDLSSAETLNDVLPGGKIVLDQRIDLSAPAFTFGVTYEPSSTWTFGAVVRPPLNLRIKATSVLSLGLDSGADGIPPAAESRGRYYMKLPLVAAVGVLCRPVPRFQVAADVSFWAWSEYTSDYSPNDYGGQLGVNSVKFNLGAAYAFELPFGFLREVTVRSGYIYDPQPYRAEMRFSRNFTTAGLGLKIWRINLDVAAKLAVLSPEPRRFRSNQFRAGLSVLF